MGWGLKVLFLSIKYLLSVCYITVCTRLQRYKCKQDKIPIVINSYTYFILIYICIEGVVRRNQAFAKNILQQTSSQAERYKEYKLSLQLFGNYFKIFLICLNKMPPLNLSSNKILSLHILILYKFPSFPFSSLSSSSLLSLPFPNP